MSQYKVINNSPVFAYVNGELMHDFPKRIMKKGQIVEGEKQMLLLTDPEKGSANLPFLRMHDDKYIKLKNLKPMLNYSKSGNSNFSNIVNARPCHSGLGNTPSGGSIQSGTFTWFCNNGTWSKSLSRSGASAGSAARSGKKPCSCNAAMIYFGLCKDPNCLASLKAATTQSNAAGAAPAPMNVKRYVINGVVMAGVGFAISHFALKGKHKIAYTVGGLAVGLGIAFLSGKKEAKIAAKLAVTLPTPAPAESSDNTEDGVSNVVGNSGKYFPKSGNKMVNPKVNPQSTFNTVQDSLMGADSDLRKMF